MDILEGHCGLKSVDSSALMPALPILAYLCADAPSRHSAGCAECLGMPRGTSVHRRRFLNPSVCIMEIQWVDRQAVSHCTVVLK